MYDTHDETFLPYLHYNNTCFALRNLQRQMNQPSLTEGKELLEWTPLIALRHTVQQIMIRNIASQTEPNSSIPNSRMSCLSTTLSATSSNSGESLSSSPPVTPLCTEFWNEIGIDINCDRSSLISPRSSSFISVDSQVICNKHCVQSSLKAAKLLGIDGITTVSSNSRHSSFSKSSFSKSFSGINSKRNSLITSSPSRSKSLVEGLFFKKPSSGVYLESLLPHMSLHSWLDFQTVRSSLFSSHFKQSYIVCCDRTLYQFTNDNNTSTATHHLNITNNLKISTLKEKLTLSDSSQGTWCLRFKDSGSLNYWLSHLHSLLSPNVSDQRLSIPPCPSTSYRFSIPFRPKFSMSKHFSKP